MQTTPADVKFYAEGSSTALGADGTPVTLTLGTTYYVDIGSAEESRGSIQWQHDASIIATITYEVTNFPESSAGLSAAASDDWHPDPAMGVTAIPGGAVGCPLVHMADDGAARMRAKIVVGATGGNLRGRLHRKGR